MNVWLGCLAGFLMLMLMLMLMLILVLVLILILILILMLMLMLIPMLLGWGGNGVLVQALGAASGTAPSRPRGTSN
ncbi:hypothetical protein P154DRAFT_122906 [Amniculicola lignicola CBS 123094]|uniref:Uncharacterized protein n=1 Tax=Amniculicola lignicola CBS 123094 TaxID=1392246 RepID=A0A6A5WUP4_9PLEO|nr:hypothetical protein P154DRAFT_122906 [Amniculicola lignicola CBS 123094]